MGACTIGVIGAGVVGLNTCLELQRALRNAQIIVISEKFDKDTTSDGAAGFFRPASYFTGPTLQLTHDWISHSFSFYKSLLNEPDVGIKEMSGYTLTRGSPDSIKNHYMEKLVPIRQLEEDELSEISPGNWKYGNYSSSLLIECRYFLPWALRRFLSNGGKVIQGRVNSFSDVSEFGDFDVIVNCTGLGARSLCGDTKMVPVRGQVYKVDAPWLKNFYCDENDTYVFPGISAATLGGTRNFGSWKTQVDKHDSASIWERCTEIVPRLKEARVVREWVGLRPYRPVVRVQPEIINGLKVVHNYGHGGYGVTSAPGTAQTAVQHVVDLLKTTTAKY